MAQEAVVAYYFGRHIVAIGGDEYWKQKKPLKTLSSEALVLCVFVIALISQTFRPLAKWFYQPNR